MALGIGKLFPIVVIAVSSFGMIAGSGMELSKKRSKDITEVVVEIKKVEEKSPWKEWSEVVEDSEEFMNKEVQIKKEGKEPVQCTQISKNSFLCPDFFKKQ
ncbi:hypothetical protein [Mycoplasma suis]|uniref:Uncharacterized protein n=2 Tax=Mycoplasma suis TaxID=57372 RepID=F0QRJ6_MYCSL|nr:hypothetical protein [Mycoplasma suis]ADX98116.1 hypothetical protein MSU_0584 [Mycoplasma suis str. Illinois]CBZ40629.1 hypothetical protein MSUIS_05360 [Mycoplasma suis KI3806]